MTLSHTPQEMFSNINYASGRGDRLSGRVDAVYNVSMLMTGDYTEERLEEIHAEVLQEDQNGAYVAGYEEAWNSLFNLIYGLQPNELHKQLGPFV